MRSVFRMMRRAISSKFAVLVFCSSFMGAGALYAQTYIKPGKPSGKKLYLGFDVSFGTRLFRVQSNIDAINGMDVLEEGGSAGVLFGNNVAQVKIRHGYYYSAARVPYTTDLVQTSLEMDINPLQLVKSKFKRCEPYLLAGVARDAVKFHGHYVDVSGSNTYEDRGESKKPNYSRSEMPYLGSVASTRVETGLGMTYRVKMIDSFVRFYGEVRYGYSLGTSATQQFEKTTAANQVSFSLGTSFGWKLK